MLYAIIFSDLDKKTLEEQLSCYSLGDDNLLLSFNQNSEGLLKIVDFTEEQLLTASGYCTQSALSAVATR